MQHLRHLVFSLVVTVTLVGSLIVSGCGSDDEENTAPAAANNVGGRAFTFTDGAAIDPGLRGKTTVVAFNADATRVAITSGANRATGTNRFGSCIFQIGNGNNPDAVGGGSNFPVNGGPQPNQIITLTTCDVDTNTNTLNVVNSNGTSGTSDAPTPTGTGGFGG